MDHPFAADVVRQAAERLGADDVFIAGLGKLQHFGREQPSFPHFVAVADHAADQALDMRVRFRRLIARNAPDGRDQRVLHAQQIIHQQLYNKVLRRTSAVELDILQAVVNLEERKIHQAGHVDLAVLPAQKILQVVVPERRVFHIDLAHDADLDLGRFPDFNGAEVPCDPEQHLFLLFPAHGLAVVELIRQVFDPFFNFFIALALMHLVGFRLVAKQHQRVAVNQRGDKFPQHRQCDVEPGVVLQKRKVERNHGDLFQTGLFQRLAQQMNVVGGAAAAARLRNDEGRFVHVVFSGMQRVDKLADHQQGGVAGVVVDVFQALLHHVRSAVVEQLEMIAAVFQHVDEQMEMNRRHGGGKNRVFPLHFPGEQQTAVFRIFQLCQGGHLIPQGRRTGCEA